jgi:hypothetical protein
VASTSPHSSPGTGSCSETRATTAVRPQSAAAEGRAQSGPKRCRAGHQFLSPGAASHQGG